jgi:hypothetical protein
MSSTSESCPDPTKTSDQSHQVHCNWQQAPPVDNRPIVKFSDAKMGCPFFGEVTSKRTGVTTRGVFVKLAQHALLIENPYDTESTTEQGYTDNPPYFRHIKPEVLVEILYTTSGHLTPDRVPLLLDDLDVRDFCYVERNQKFGVPSAAIAKEIGDAERSAKLLRLIETFAGPQDA